MHPTKVLYAIAGVDYETLLRCPKTDRLWAAHLGFSLILSFLVVGAITYHATSYVVSNVPARIAVSAVVALTISMFDRALYQADWFLQAPVDQSEWSGTRIARIALRLLISICLSFALAVFLELAIFSDTISEKLHDDFRQANAHLFRKAQEFEESLDRQIAERRTALAGAEEAQAAHGRGDLQGRTDLHELQTRLLQVRNERISFENDKNAELFGRRTRAGQTGVAGRGPAYRFAEAQAGLLREQEDDLKRQIDDLESKHTTSRADLERQIDDIRAEMAALVASRAANAVEFRRTLVEQSPEFQKLKSDPLARMTAYAALKQDPERGTAIVIFSWLVRLFVAFLEVVPVAAKMLFCPPSVYGAIVKAEVNRERRRAEAVVTEAIEPPLAAPISPQPQYVRTQSVRAQEPPRKERHIPEIVIRKPRAEETTPAVG
jgi:hypothetical protein